MTDVSGIPNMGFGGGGYFGGIPNQQPAMSADQINASMWGSYSPTQAQIPLQNNFNNFGQQTDYYSALGAAYGRNTGGFGGGGGGVVPGGGYYDDAAGLNSSTAPNGGGAPQFDPWTGAYMAGGAGDTWSRGAPSSGVVGGWYDPYGGGGGYPMPQASRASPPVQSQDWQSTFNNTVHGSAYDPYSIGDSSWYPSQRSAVQQAIFDPWTGAVSGYAPTAGADFSYLDQWQSPVAANPGYFNPGAYAGDQNNYGIPNNGRAMPGDIGFSQQSPMPNLGYNPGMSNWFANPGMSGGNFQSRFGMGFPNAGTPSQYAPGAAMPPGFSPSFGADSPGGALPLSGPYSADPFGLIHGGG